MAEITKITTPMMPKENTTIKHRPVTDQAIDFTDPSKVHKSDNEGQIRDRERQPDPTTLWKDSMGRPAVMTLLKNPNEIMQAFKKLALLVEMGVSASDAAKDVSTKELLQSLFVSAKQVSGLVAEQDKSSVLFKGEAFDVLRDIMSKFEDSPKVKDAVVNLLKTFDQNVNAQNSVKTILFNCANLLDYMFSKDKSQFSNYLNDLARMLMPKDEAAAFSQKAGIANPQQQANEAAQGGQQGTVQQGQQANPQQATQGALPEQAQNSQNTQNPQGAQNAQNPQNPQGAQNPTNPQNPQGAQNAQNPPNLQNPQNPDGQRAMPQNGLPEQAQTQQERNDPLNQGLSTQRFGSELHQAVRQAAAQSGETGQMPQLSQKETAQILKNNLLPLLSEIVVKYNQSNKIRDTVMAVVHNIVRVDRGTPEALNSAVSKLVETLKDVADVPKSFERQLLEAVNQSVKDVKEQPNNVLSKMSDIISGALSSADTNPAVLRQAESMLISMLQNQGSMMDILHFIIPFQTAMGQVFTELYVDPETEEKVGKQKGESHKIFLSVETEAHGAFELCFLETNEHVDFSVWAPEDVVQSLSGLKRNFADIMQMHGYTMNSFMVDEMKAPHTVAEVFPRLIEKKVGIDVNA